MGPFVAAAVVAGAFLGHAGAIPPSLTRSLDTVTTLLLGVLLFFVGVQVGGNRQAVSYTHLTLPTNREV